MLPLLLAAPAIAKGLLGAYQLTQHVNRTDTTTPAEREQLAMARQAAGAQLPGLGQAQGRLAQTQNAAVQAASLGAGGASDFLGSVNAADRVRQNGEQQLGIQGQQYRDQATRQLGATLSAYAQHQRADTDRAAQANAQLKSAALNNLFGGLSDGASVAAAGAGGADAMPAGAEAELPMRTPELITNPAASPRYPVPFDGPTSYGPYQRRSGAYFGY